MDWIQNRIVYRLHLIVSNVLYPIDRIQDSIVYQGLNRDQIGESFFMSSPEFKYDIKSKLWEKNKLLSKVTVEKDQL